MSIACNDGAATANASPAVQIISPTEGTATLEGLPISFRGTAIDPEDGQLEGNSLVWTSDLQGTIGTGTSFEKSDLVTGHQAIQLTATDSDGLSATAGVSLIIQIDSTPATVSGRIVRSNDNAGFDDVRVSLTGGTLTVTVRSNASGEFEFADVIRGDYVIRAHREDLPAFGTFSTPESIPISVKPGDAVTDVVIQFRVAEVVLRTLSTPSSISVGAVATVALELALTDVPLPLAGIAGRVAWDDTRATLVTGSPSGLPWTGGFLVNDNTPGEVRFVGIAATGVDGDVIVSMTFDITAVAPGTVELDPNLTDLEVVDLQSGESTSLLEAAFVSENKGVVTIR